ncbi:hypothetical protein J6590_101126 [Homalodisca vitripennis]|nr:hypothetical protein J6590_101126 [Homalodisca vitripennis]
MAALKGRTPQTGGTLRRPDRTVPEGSQSLKVYRLWKLFKEWYKPGTPSNWIIPNVLSYRMWEASVFQKCPHNRSS